MSVDELVAEADPFVLTATDEEVELRALCRALILADGFSLLFARCNQADHRRDLIERIKAQLPNLNIQVIEFRESITHLLDEMRTRIDSPVPDAVFVLGLEYSLPRSSDAHASRLIANLNAARNSFPQTIPFPLVLWLPEYIVAAIARGAPDFFSIRSGLYSFVAALKDSMSSVQSILDSDWIGIQDLSIAEKRERVDSIRSLLADYELLPAEKRDRQIEVGLHERLGVLLSAIGSSDEALTAYSNSLMIAQELGDAAAVCNLLVHTGTVYQARGDLDEALENYQRSLRMAEEMGASSTAVGLLNHIGMIYHDRGDYDAAFENYGQALKIAEQLGIPAAIAASLHQIGNLNYVRGEDEVALENYERSLKILEQLNFRAGIGAALHQIGIVRQHRGEYDAALKHYERSLQIADELGDRANAGLSHGQIGKLFVATGRYFEAFQQLLIALITLFGLHSPSARIAVEDLKKLRARWGEGNFDAAWKQATSTQLPDWLM